MTVFRYQMKRSMMPEGQTRFKFRRRRGDKCQVYLNWVAKPGLSQQDFVEKVEKLLQE